MQELVQAANIIIYIFLILINKQNVIKYSILLQKHRVVTFKCTIQVILTSADSGRHIPYCVIIVTESRRWSVIFTPSVLFLTAPGYA